MEAQVDLGHRELFQILEAKPQVGQYHRLAVEVFGGDLEDPVQVIAGNERVIRPRLSDAAFFFETDKKTPLADRVAQLESIVFQQQLGTLGDKTRRLVNLAGALAPLLPLALLRFVGGLGLTPTQVPLLLMAAGVLAAVLIFFPWLTATPEHMREGSSTRLEESGVESLTEGAP